MLTSSKIMTSSCQKLFFWNFLNFLKQYYLPTKLKNVALLEQKLNRGDENNYPPGLRAPKSSG